MVSDRSRFREVHVAKFGPTRCIHLLFCIKPGGRTGYHQLIEMLAKHRSVGVSVEGCNKRRPVRIEPATFHDSTTSTSCRRRHVSLLAG